MRVGIIGGGIVGASAGRVLSGRGHSVTLYEQFSPFHDRGSSHGHSRIIRRAYPDAFYTECMAEAYPMWADLENLSNQKLVDECGLFYIGNEEAPRVRAVATALDSLRIPHQVLDPREAAMFAPSMSFGTDEVAIYTPEAGFVDADAALRATYSLACAFGMQIRAEAVEFDQVSRQFDAVIVSPGPWIKSFVEVDVRITMQTFGYVGPRFDGPVWIDDTSLTYGIPGDLDGQKIGAHLPGPAIDPRNSDRTPDPEQIDQIQEAALRRFGITLGGDAVFKTCLYTSTPDEDFRIGRLGSNGFFASACSGHGFKLGPWTGRLLADMAEGKDSPENHPRFAWPRQDPN